MRTSYNLLTVFGLILGVSFYPLKAQSAQMPQETYSIKNDTQLDLQLINPIGAFVKSRGTTTIDLNKVAQGQHLKLRVYGASGNFILDCIPDLTTKKTTITGGNMREPLSCN